MAPMMAAAPMIPTQMQQMQHPQLLPQPQIENFQNVPGFKQGMDTKVTTASIPLCKLPKVRLAEALEFLEERLDSTITSNAYADQELLSITVWLITNIKPNTKITDLRCKYYVEIYERLRAAKERKKLHPEFNYAELVEQLVRCELHPDQVVFFFNSLLVAICLSKMLIKNSLYRFCHLHAFEALSGHSWRN